MTCLEQSLVAFAEASLVQVGQARQIQQRLRASNLGRRVLVAGPFVLGLKTQAGAERHLLSSL
ncbi:hypothetical protein D3C71_2252420 [compost metagenome]